MNYQTKPQRVEVFHMTAESMLDIDLWPEWLRKYQDERRIIWPPYSVVGRMAVNDEEGQTALFYTPAQFAAEYEPAPDAIDFAPFVPPFSFDETDSSLRDSNGCLYERLTQYEHNGFQIAAALNRAAGVKGGAK